MHVLEQIELFNDDQLFNQPPKHLQKDTFQINNRTYEDILLNNHVLPLLRGVGTNIEQLQVCVRDVNDTWMVVEVATSDLCASMTIWNNGNKDFIHWSSNMNREAFFNQYFNRYKPAQLFYLEKDLERNTSTFFNYKT